jgi:hypothetical protein
MLYGSDMASTGTTLAVPFAAPTVRVAAPSGLAALLADLDAQNRVTPAFTDDEPMDPAQDTRDWVDR